MTNSTSLSSSSFVYRMQAWSQERFPLVNVVTGYLLYFLAAFSVRATLDLPVAARPVDVALGLALSLHFLILRVLDEHKDYAQDLIHHPERVVQRGVVTLKELRVLGFGAFGLSCAFTLLLGAPIAFSAWLAVIAWTGLMTVEFFCREWLRRRLFVYSISHLFVVPLMIVWAAALSTPRALDSAILPWICGLTLVNGVIYEILRKTKGPDEAKRVETLFSSLWGIDRALRAGMAFHCVSLVLFMAVARMHFPDASPFWLVPAVLVLALVIASLQKFKQDPVAKRRKANEATSALFVLLQYVTLIAFSFAS